MTLSCSVGTKAFGAANFIRIPKRTGLTLRLQGHSALSGTYSVGIMGTVAVVIPSRNDAQMLAACLAALEGQTRPADEIIVIDNSSSDNTASVCEAAGVRRILVDLPGVAASAAAGFDAAGSGIIARLDADSRPPADWLQRVEAILEGTGPLSAVTGPGVFYGASRLVCWLGRHLYLGGFFWAVGLLMGHPPVFGSNFAVRSEVWDRIRGAVIRDNPLVHDDFDISYHLRPDMKVTYDPTLSVGVSARPFASFAAVRSRMAKTAETFRVEFAAEPPLRRHSDRRRWEREHNREHPRGQRRSLGQRTSPKRARRSRANSWGEVSEGLCPPR